MSKYEQICRELESALRVKEAQERAEERTRLECEESLTRMFAKWLGCKEENLHIDLNKRDVLASTPIGKPIVRFILNLSIDIETETFGIKRFQYLHDQCLQLIDGKLYLGDYLVNKGFFVDDEKEFDAYCKDHFARLLQATRA